MQQVTPVNSHVQVTPTTVLPTSNVQPTLPNNVQEVPVPEPNFVDPNIVTLSTGFTVKFNVLPKPISDEFVTTIFNATELDEDNNIRIDSNDKNEQIRVATKFMTLNTSIIGAGGVKLLDELPPEEQWLDQVIYAPTIMEKYPHINTSKLRQRDKEFLFLRYFAFADEDLALLSEKCLNQG